MNESIEYIYDGTDHAMGVSAAEAAFLRYRDAGLRVPPVPRELVDRLAEQAEWLFATDARDLCRDAAERGHSKARDERWSHRPRRS